MRIASSLVVLLAASQAYADHGSGASFEVGYVRNRVAVTDQTALPGELARFALRVSIGRHFHFGGEVEEGRLAGSTPLRDGAVARTTEPMQGPLEGNTLGLKAYAGVHAKVSVFMFGADVATGMRDTSVSSLFGDDIAGRKNELLLELRSRADVWLTRRLTVGAMVSTDVLERRDVAVGAVLALHFTD